MFDEIVDFLTSGPMPEQIIAFKPSKKAQKRFSLLLEKKREDKLTDTEQQEIEHFLVIEHLMRLAGSLARRRGSLRE